MSASKRSTQRRSIAIAIFCVVAGVTATVACDVLCAVYSTSNPRFHVSYPSNPPISQGTQAGFGVQRRFVDILTRNEDDLQLIPDDWHARAASIQDIKTSLSASQHVWLAETRAGWPMACAVGSASTGLFPRIIVLTHDALPAKQPTLTQPFVYFIPYKPLWVGLLVDVAFWSMIVWLASRAIVLPRTLMRWWRRRHGQCPICGYPIRDTRGGCPECGEQNS